MPGHGSLQQPAGDDHAIDFVGALKDSIHTRVAIGALCRVLLHKSVTRIDLHHFVNYAVEHLRSPDFKYGTLHGVLFDGFPDFASGVGAALINIGERHIHHPDRAIDHRFPGKNPNCHVRQFFLDEPEVRDGLIERLALLGITDRMPQRGASAAHAHGP